MTRLKSENSQASNMRTLKLPCVVLVTVITFEDSVWRIFNKLKGEMAMKKIVLLFAIEFLLVAGAMSALVVHAHSVRVSSHT